MHRLGLLSLVFIVALVQVECAVTANFITDPRSMLPKVMRTKNAFHFIQFFMGTFKQMFRYKTHIRGIDCHISDELDFSRLKAYFERYSKTHFDPKINAIFAVMTKDGLHMTVEFHVTSRSSIGFEHHFHMVIRAFNDDTVGWGVRHLSMAYDC